MSTSTSRRMPSISTVFREHLTAIRDRNRREAILLISAAVMLTLLPYGYVWLTGRGDQFEWNLTPDTFAMLLVAVSLFAPFAVWKGEDLSRRTYLFAMPMDRSRNQLVKVAAGWVWLLAATLLLYALAAVAAALSGSEIGVSYARFFTGQNVDAATPADFFMTEIRTPWWNWLVPITATTTAYLLMSALVVGVTHPWRWIGALWLLLLGAGLLAETLNLSGLMDLIENLIDNRTWYALLTAVTGRVDTLQSVPGLAQPAVVSRPNMSAWLTSTTIWMGLGLAGTAIAAARHRES